MLITFGIIYVVDNLMTIFWKPDVVVLPELRCEYTINLALQFMQWGGIAIAKRTEGGLENESSRQSAN
jgi:Tfp pilus assembly ATPase PilU